MKSFLTTLLFLLCFVAYGQQTITLTENLVLTETLVIEEATTYEGNGFSIICEGCAPAIKVKNGVRVHFENVRFPKTFASWLAVEGPDMTNVSWNGPRMSGFIRVEDN